MTANNPQWYWNGAPNPFSKDQTPQWIAYNTEDNKKIEDALKKKAVKAELTNHNVHFHECMQVHKDDFHRQRPVKREPKP